MLRYALSLERKFSNIPIESKNSQICQSRQSANAYFSQPCWLILNMCRHAVRDFSTLENHVQLSIHVIFWSWKLKGEEFWWYFANSLTTGESRLNCLNDQGAIIVYWSVTKLKSSLQGANFIQNCRGNCTISSHLNAKKPLMTTKGKFFTLELQKC